MITLEDLLNNVEVQGEVKISYFDEDDERVDVYEDDYISMERIGEFLKYEISYIYAIDGVTNIELKVGD